MNELDERFLRTAYRSIALVWLISVIVALLLQRQWIALNITLGMALGTAILYSFDYVVRRAFVPGAKRPGRALLLLALVKYPIIFGLLFRVLTWDKVDVLAFSGGIVLVHFALFMAFVGMMPTDRRKAQGTEQSDPVPNREN